MILDFIFSIPFILRIIITLIVILLLNKVSNNLIFSVIVGTIVIALWTKQSLFNILNISWMRLSSSDNIFLLVVVLQVIYLSSQMKESGVMADLVMGIRSRTSQKMSMALLPAIIGLLPMPGGAIFSAPMVDDCDHDKSISNDLKTRINYWFRHVWEYWWPLYPGVLLAIDISGLQVWQFVLLQLPLSIFSVLGGYFFLLRKIKVSTKDVEIENNRSHKIITLISPILIVIFVYAFVRMFFPKIAQINKYLPMIIGLIISQVVLHIQRPLKLNKYKEMFFSIKAFKMALIVAIIRVYAAFIEAKLPDGTFLMNNVREELFMLNIPIIAIIMIIPFLSGMSMGIAVGFVGTSFPIVVNLIGGDLLFTQYLSYLVLAFSFGYTGMILSPVHVCLLVTNEYFKSDLSKNIIRLIKPSLVVIIGAVLLHIILRFIL